VFHLSADLGIPSSLRELRIPKEFIPQMADSAVKVARPMMNNPRPVYLETARELYERAFEGEREE
jgi:alcohol dehydrogenase class IV